jgi:hypothetical protein
MSPVQELESCLNEFCDTYNSDQNNAAVKLLARLTRYVLGKQESPVQEEWLDAFGLCSKYPIMCEGTTHEFIRYIPASDLDFVKWNGNKPLFQPRKLFVYIVKNKSRNPRIYAKLKRANYFGLIKE